MVSPWFERLFGFAESSYDETRARFELEGSTLRSRANDRVFPIGSFSTPTLASLRARARGLSPGRLTLRHEVIGDVLELHAAPDNRGALFQVASQFNCLEFADPRATPEDGVTNYASDPTQGPACALAAAAATVVRNYFALVDGEAGQRADRQLDNLDALAARLGAPGEYFEVRNGYTWSDEARLQRLATAMQAHEHDDLLGAVKIGLQEDVGVTFARRFVEPDVASTVSQAFCSALSCGYSGVALEHWEPLATLALDAAYEATFLAAALGASQAGDAPRTVWLTLLGGGAFGNRSEWIGRAIGKAVTRCESFALDVRVAHYKRQDAAIVEEIARGRRA